MSERKNIDRLFQEKFKDFEADPSEQSWKNIEARLKAKKDRKVIPFWFKLSGIAAALLIGFFVTDRFSENGNGNRNSIVISPKSSGKNGPVNNISKESQKSTGKENEVITSSGEPAKTSDSPSGPVQGKSERNYRLVNKNNGIPNEDNSVVAGTEKNHKKDFVHKNGKSKYLLNDLPNGKENNAVAESAKNNSRSKRSAGKSNGAINRRLAEKQNNIVESGRNKSRISNNKAGIQPNSSTIAQLEGTKKTTGKRTVKAGNTADLKSANPDGQLAANVKNGAAKNIDNKVTEIKTQTQAIAAIDSKKADNGKTKKDSTAIATVEPNALGELLNEKENKSVTESGQKINRWQLYTHVAPIYLSSASEGSSIDPNLSKNGKDYKTSISYGVGLSYAISKKIAIRAGVNSVAMEYNTNDIVFRQSASARELAHVDNNISGSLLNIQSSAATPPPGATSALLIVPTKSFSGSLNQKTAYIEVPVEMSYKLLDKKIGVDVIGGVSTLFLQQNEISLISGGSEMSIGKADNLNTTHFSGNLGLGLKYNILKSFQFNLEPMLKYQINTYSSGDFKPYFFGIYTGLNYRF